MASYPGRSPHELSGGCSCTSSAGKRDPLPSSSPTDGPRGSPAGTWGLSPHAASLSAHPQVCISDLTEEAVLIS